MSHPPHEKPPSKELRICGLAAVQARFQRDPGSIQRLFFDEATGRKVGVVSKALAAARKVYRCVGADELEKIAGSKHHGGIVAIVSVKKLQSPGLDEIARWAAARASVLLLDRIGNAHNLGAIARTAAFFGVGHLIIPAHPAAAVPNDAAHRVAEGGLDHLLVWRVPALPTLMNLLAGAGYDVVGAAASGGRPVAPKENRPLAIVLGNEEHGLDSAVATACTRLVTIAGTGRIESLNVSVAAGVLMHAMLPGPRTDVRRPPTGR